MKQYFALQPFSGMGKSGYRAKFVNRAEERARSFDDIVTAAAKASMLDGPPLAYAYRRVIDEAIGGALATGAIQHLGDYGSLMLNIHGKFDGVDDRFDADRHSLDFRFVAGRALKGLTPQFEVENVVKPMRYIVNEIGPACETGRTHYESRYLVRGLPIVVNVANGPLGDGSSIRWVAETLDRRSVTGAFTVLKNEAARLLLDWSADVPVALHKDVLTLVFIVCGEAGSTPQERRMTVPLYEE